MRRTSEKRVISKAPPTNTISEAIEKRKSSNVTGLFLGPFLYVTIHLNMAGRSVKVIKMTEKIPMIDMVAIDFNAGCLAKIRTPMPSSVVIPDMITDIL
jgi:hypothetical protein